MVGILMPDDVQALAQEPNSAIGEIRIEIYKAKEIPKDDDDTNESYNMVALTPVIVHETSFKAGFHSVQYVNGMSTDTCIRC